MAIPAAERDSVLDGYGDRFGRLAAVLIGEGGFQGNREVELQQGAVVLVNQLVALDFEQVELRLALVRVLGLDDLECDTGACRIARRCLEYLVSGVIGIYHDGFPYFCFRVVFDPLLAVRVDEFQILEQVDLGLFVGNVFRFDALRL